MVFQVPRSPLQSQHYHTGLSQVKAMRSHSLDGVERIAIAESYEYERLNEDELHIILPGAWAHYSLSVQWDHKTETLAFFMSFDGHIWTSRSEDICRLVLLLNTRVHIGHFDYWEENAALVYRYSIPLSGGAVLNADQIMCVLAQALEAAERGYPACQYVLWSGKTPEEALNRVLMDISAAT